MEGKRMRASDWVRVEERLPQNCEDVLVIDERYGMVIGSYDPRCEVWMSYEYGYMDYVTHWQPIELPQKTNDGEHN